MAEYKNAIVTYIDFLGFRKLLEQKTPNEIVEILTLLKDMGNFQSYVQDGPHGEASTKITSVATFSDHIIRQIEYEQIGLATALGMEMPVLARLQFELLIRQRDPLLVRGAISKGRSHVTNEFAFGPAMVKSYELEQIAQFSRIVIDFDLIGEVLVEERPGWEHTLRRGEDGMFFIDYLTSVIKHHTFTPIHVKGRDNILAQHRGAVDQKLTELMPSKNNGLRQKALWLAQYHNSVIDRFIKENPEDEMQLRSMRVDEKRMRPR